MEYKKAVGRKRKRGRKPASFKGTLKRDLSPYQTKNIDIVSREGQPQVRYRVPMLKQQNIPSRPVSSSWIADLGYEDGVAEMGTQSGRDYDIELPIEVFNEWFHAHSKGTFYNRVIKGRFPTVRA